MHPDNHDKEIEDEDVEDDNSMASSDDDMEMTINHVELSIY